VGESAPLTDPDAQPELSEEINLDLQLDRERLRSAREAKGLEINQASSAAGITPSTLRKIEHGENANPNFQTIARLAIVLGLSLDELITRS
jgi:transcriptional regulator with XRE-family HTH domain